MADIKGWLLASVVWVLFSNVAVPQLPKEDEPAWLLKLFGSPDKLKHDFGTVERGKLLVHEYKLHNVHNFPVKVIQIKAVASVDPSIDKRVLEPNEKATITVKMDSARFVGPKTVSIAVTAEAKTTGVVRLQVSAVSKEPDRKYSRFSHGTRRRGSERCHCS